MKEKDGVRKRSKEGKGKPKKTPINTAKTQGSNKAKSFHNPEVPSSNLGLATETNP